MSAILAVVKAAAVAATTALLVSSAVVSADAAQTHRTPAAPAARVRVAAVTPTATVDQVNTFLATVKADAGTSVKLPDGRVLWLFGDEATPDGHSLLGRNTAALQSGATFTHLTGEFRHTTTAGWYWPGAAAIDGGKLVILWSQETATGTGAFDFKQTATVAATYNAATLVETSETTTTAAIGGSSAVLVGSTWHVYGTRAVAGSYGKDVLQWTAPAGKLGAMASWSSSSLVLPASWGAGTDVAVAQDGGHLRLWTKRFDIVGSTIVTSSNAGGSWSAPATVATTGAWTYAVHVHPEQAHPLLTYALNGGTSAQTGAYHLYTLAIQ